MCRKKSNWFPFPDDPPLTLIPVASLAFSSQACSSQTKWLKCAQAWHVPTCPDWQVLQKTGMHMQPLVTEAPAELLHMYSRLAALLGLAIDLFNHSTIIGLY